MSASAMLTVRPVFRHEAQTLGPRLEQRRGDLLDQHLALAAGVHRGLLHDLVPDRRHLRPVVRGDDRGHDVAAERRARLQQVLRFRIDRQPGAVGRQAGVDGHGHARDQAAPDRRGAAQQDVGLVLRDQVHQDRRIRLVLEIGQLGPVHHVDLVRAPLRSAPGPCGVTPEPSSTAHSFMPSASASLRPSPSSS